VSESSSCILVAEVAQSHDGSLGTAHAYIDAAAAAGANVIKFQTHIAAAESHPSEPWRIQFSRQDASRYDYWRRMEFSEDQWLGLRDHARDAGLLFASSPFSIEAVELLDRIGVDIWKVASGELGNEPLLDRVAADGRPVVVSSGMSTWDELDSVVAVMRKRNVDLTVLQCTTAYPCPPERLGLNVIDELRRRYKVPVGLSDHSGTIFAGLAAAALGIAMLEVHVTFSRAAFGPDVPASILFEELTELAQGIRFIETAVGHPVDKEAVARESASLRQLFSRSIVARIDLAEGAVVRPQDLAYKKPGTGLPPSAAGRLVGRRLVRSVAADTMLAETDVQ
jgi:N,N'-diacetyllegionaminate synthase